MAAQPLDAKTVVNLYLYGQTSTPDDKETGSALDCSRLSVRGSVQFVPLEKMQMSNMAHWR